MSLVKLVENLRTPVCDTSEVAYLAFVSAARDVIVGSASVYDDGSGSSLFREQLLHGISGRWSCENCGVLGFVAGEGSGQVDGVRNARRLDFKVGADVESAQGESCGVAGGVGTGNGVSSMGPRAPCDSGDVGGFVDRTGEDSGVSSRVDGAASEGGYGSGVGSRGVDDGVEQVGAEHVDMKKLARREKNKRRRSNRRERKNSEPDGCPVPEWRRGASVQLPVFPARGAFGRPSGLPDVKKGFFSDLTVERRVELQSSRAALLVKQNELAAVRADRELEVLRATDIEVEKKRQATKLRAAIERNMVSIEKTHATLKATDNVGRDELDHDVHTVVTDGVPSLSSGSISPNSSASMAEFRAVQKQLLDEQKKLSDVEAKNEKLSAALKKLGVEESVVDYLDKDLWTINSEGTLDDDAKAALDVLAPEGYVIPGQAYMSKGDKAVIRAL